MSAERCPNCGGRIGDGDRVTYGICALCQIRGRRGTRR